MLIRSSVTLFVLCVTSTASAIPHPLGGIIEAELSIEKQSAPSLQRTKALKFFLILEDFEEKYLRFNDIKIQFSIEPPQDASDTKAP